MLEFQVRTRQECCFSWECCLTKKEEQVPGPTLFYLAILSENFLGMRKVHK